MKPLSVTTGLWVDRDDIAVGGCRALHIFLVVHDLIDAHFQRVRVRVSVDGIRVYMFAAAVHRIVPVYVIASRVGCGSMRSPG